MLLDGFAKKQAKKALELLIRNGASQGGPLTAGQCKTNVNVSYGPIATFEWKPTFIETKAVHGEVDGDMLSVELRLHEDTWFYFFDNPSLDKHATFKNAVFGRFDIEPFSAFYLGQAGGKLAPFYRERHDYFDILEDYLREMTRLPQIDDSGYAQAAYREAQRSMMGQIENAFNNVILPAACDHTRRLCRMY